MADFEVLLSNCGNIDLGQDPTQPMYGTESGVWKKVADLDAASQVCRDYLDDNDLGSGNWTGGDVRNAETQEVVAKISYNGRIWPVDEPSARSQP
jgi:hypothetical protein